MKTFRIFISSPGDVRSERVRALDVAQKLQTKYRAFIHLEPILWEHEAMSAFSSFQPQIVPPSKTDIVVCILWARIGMRLPSDYKRPDGTVPTGTEWEFEDAYKAHLINGSPDLYVYRKTAKPLIEFNSDDELVEWQRQKKSLDGFLDHWFKGHDDSFKAAFNNFETDKQFEELLTGHLEGIIEAKVRSGQDGAYEEERKITWFEGSPFLGLRAFQPEHAPIFFGRDLDTRKILDRLKRQAADKGRVFLMVLGMSGCGKSSLARAGVLPALQRPGETEWDCWKHAILRPSDATHGLLLGLAEALLKSLPELAQSGYNSEKLGVLLRDAPVHAIPIIEAALNHAAKILAQEKGLASINGARLFVLIDQFEEIFTLERFREERTGFVAALAALSRSGLAWVVVTMRSDLYGRCTEISELMALKADDGHYDLTPPGFAELAQMIRLPAYAGGLRYDVDPQTGRKLEDALLEEAWKNPEALPLLEFTLDELFKAKSSANVLTWQAYHDLGGMQGAIAKCAEAEYEQLSAAGKEAVPWVFARLVTLEQSHATAQQASVSELVAKPGASEVTQRFIAAKLFVTSAAQASAANEESLVVVSVAHEALLSSWPLLRDWIENHRENLKSHAAVTADTKRWIENARATDYLYRRGQPLDRAREVLDGDFLSQDEQEFVRASLKKVAELEFLDSLATGERMFEVSQQLKQNYPELRIKMMRDALASTIETTRAHVATLLGMEPVEELSRSLVQVVLNDPKESVRRAAAASLVQLDQSSYFEELTNQQDTDSNPGVIEGLAHVRVAADTVEKPTTFEPMFHRLKRGRRSRIITRSRVLRLKRGWPTLFIVLIPAVVLSSAFAAIFKTFPAAFNYAVCQAQASAPTGFFQAVVACFFWGGFITLGITFHRVVLRSELGKKSFLRPWGALVAGAIGGAVSSALLLLVLTIVCEPAGTIGMGWTDKDWHYTDWGTYWNDILWQSRGFWPYMFMGTGLGIGMAMMTNKLWASSEWASFIGKQSFLTGQSALSLVKPLAKLMFKFCWPIPVCMLVADSIAFYVVRHAPLATHAPAWLTGWSDVFFGGLSSHHAQWHLDGAQLTAHLREWKMSAWGQMFGIVFDSVTQSVGGFFCIIGIGLGLIAIRYGVKIEPRKN